MTEIRISISSPSSNDSRDDGYVNLRIEDAASGVCLTDVNIPAGRWWRLCQGSSQRHDALVSSHLDRVGKRMETNAVSLGKVWDATDERAAELAEAHELRAQYDTAEVRRTNAGWEAVFRRWVAVEGADQ